MSLCDTRKAMKMGATNVEKRSLKTKHLAPIFRAELKTDDWQLRSSNDPVTKSREVLPFRSRKILRLAAHQRRDRGRPVRDHHGPVGRREVHLAGYCRYARRGMDR